jgi:DNA invertase Pin-like site-specific DNA recombinase
VSTNDQNCDRQIQELTTYAERCGYDVAAIYRETASGGKNDRLERKKAIDLARSRNINAIFVTELSRWGRSTEDLISTLNNLHRWGVSLIAQSGLELDLSTPHGKLMVTILSGLAEFERELIRERVMSGLALAASRGKKLGRPKGGIRETKCTEIRDRHNQGQSYSQIGKDLKISKSSVGRCFELPEGMDF